MENNSSKKNMHTNHRARMREKLFNGGAGAFHDHELLEILLFASESRKNTNDTAHALIERFGSLHGVFTAGEDALRDVHGVKDAATAQVLVIREIMRRIDAEKLELPGSFDSIDALGKYLVHMYKYASAEEMYVLMFDNGMRMIGCVRVCQGTVNSTPVNMRSIVKEVMAKDASSVIISHNHPGGKIIASPDDAIMTRNIATVLNSIGVELIDHILVAEDKYTSIMHVSY